jgi:hypothetical protein
MSNPELDPGDLLSEGLTITTSNLHMKNDFDWICSSDTTIGIDLRQMQMWNPMKMEEEWRWDSLWEKTWSGGGTHCSVGNSRRIA